MKTKRTRINPMTAFMIVAGLLLTGGIALYLSYDTPAPQYSDSITPPPLPQPKQFCSDAGHTCLIAPADWLNMNTNEQSPHMRLVDRRETVQVLFSHDFASKKTACKAGECLMRVIALEKFSALPDVMLVKAVTQDTRYGTNVPSEFLLSANDASTKGLAVGKTIDLRAQVMPTYTRTIGNKTYTQYLEGTSNNPGNYSSLEEASRWFDTAAGKAVDQVIRSFTLQ